MRVSVHAPAQARVGEAVTIELRIENVSTKILNLSLQGRDIAFDVMVTTRGGQPVWRRLEHQTLQTILRLEPIAPGATLRLPAAWRPEEPGDFIVSGIILTDAAPLQSNAVPLRVR